MAESGLTLSRGSVRSFAEDYGLLVVAGVFLLIGVAGVVLFLFGDRSLAVSLIEDYGLLALTGIFVLEGAMLLYFAPSELVVPVSIEFLATTPGGYRPPMIVAIFGVAVLFATVGQTLLFVLARRGGREWLLEKPWFRVRESHLDRFDDWFDRWGPIAVPVSNALPFTRGMLTVPAGISEMSVRRFAALSALGTLAFEAWLAVVYHIFNEVGFFGWL